MYGGEGGIRTHGTIAGTPVFETGPIDHSGTSPQGVAFDSRARNVTDARRNRNACGQTAARCQGSTCARGIWGDRRATETKMLG